MRQIAATLVLVSFLATPALYAGGGVKEKAKGSLWTQSAREVVFSMQKDGSVTMSNGSRRDGRGSKKAAKGGARKTELARAAGAKRAAANKAPKKALRPTRLGLL